MLGINLNVKKQILKQNTNTQHCIYAIAYQVFNSKFSAFL